MTLIDIITTAAIVRMKLVINMFRNIALMIILERNQSEMTFMKRKVRYKSRRLLSHR